MGSKKKIEEEKESHNWNSLLSECLQDGRSIEQHKDWERLAGPEFSLRTGPDYKKNGLKAPSQRSLYDMFAIELVRSEKRIHHISKHLDWGRIRKHHPVVETDEVAELCRAAQIPRYMVVHFLFPLEDDAFLWRSEELKCKNCSMVQVSSISDHCLKLVKDSLELGENGISGSIGLLRKFFDVQEGNQYLRRFKGVAEIMSLEEYGFNAFIKPILYRYNAKPFVIKNTSTFFKDEEISYLEVDIDVHEFNSIARRVFSGIRDMIPELQLNFGWTIEGREDDELPECIVSAFTVKSLNIKSCPVIFSDLVG